MEEFFEANISEQHMLIAKRNEGLEFLRRTRI